jgi:hypothetical protein
MGLPPIASALHHLVLLSPLHLVIALGRDVLGLQVPAGTVSHRVWIVLAAFAAQGLLAVLARKLERRSALGDDFAYVAHPGD